MQLLMTFVWALVLIVALLSGFAIVLLMERKLLGWMQYRIGPNRTGPWGLLQPIADAAKAMFKEDIIPEDADRIVFMLAPTIAVFVALSAYAVVPVAPGVQLVNPDAGLLVLLAIGSLGVYGVALGGWAAQSKYSLLGSLRSTAQMISYELAMGMSIIGVVAIVGSVNLNHIVAAQIEGGWFLFRPWGLGLIGFVIFFISILAETNRTPFDLPEAEAELVSGYNTEYSGMRFALFVMAEYVHMITTTSLATLLFLGGWSAPGFVRALAGGSHVLPPIVWFLLKVGLLLFVFIWLRATLPRLRYDRLMNLGWKYMLPMAVVNLLLVASLVAAGLA